MDKKKLIPIIGIIAIIIALIGTGTYAWFKWSSPESIDVSVNIDNSSGLVITFNGGSNITGTFEPTLTKEEGIVKNFSASTNGIKVPMALWLKINTLPVELKNATFKWELYKNGSYLADSDFSLGAIDNRTKQGDYDYYLCSDIVGSTTVNYTLYLWIDGNVDNNSNMANKSINFDLYGSVSTETPFPIVLSGASVYITNLYNSATKNTATVNSITYNLAPSVGLMNDRHASMSTDINGGDIRYYGANPDNYVWLGDTFNSTYTYNSNDTDITRNAGDKKLWRIIGVFDGRLKLISNDFISNTLLSWSHYDSNSWSEADLRRLLNEGYTGTNGSLYWNKGIGTVYTGSSTVYTGSSSTASNVDFSNTGLSNNEKEMIDTATWYQGASKNGSYADVQYNAERQSAILGNADCPSTCGSRSPVWRGKVGLLYLSDYGYATDFSQCTRTISDYAALNSGCFNNDWLSESSNFQWTLSTKYAGNGCTCHGVYRIKRTYNSSYNYATMGSIVRAVVYLKPNVYIYAGSGTEQDPYVLELY